MASDIKESCCSDPPSVDPINPLAANPAIPWIKHNSKATFYHPTLALNLNGVASSATHRIQFSPLGPSLVANMVVGSESSSKICVKIPTTLLDLPDLHEAGKIGKTFPLLETFDAFLPLSAVKYQLNRPTSG